MSKRVNTTLINQRNSELSELVQLAIFIESLESEGTTPEDFLKKAKDKLGLEETDLLQLEGGAKLAKHNKQVSAFISLANAIIKAEETEMISEDSLNLLKEEEKKLAGIIASQLEMLDIEDFYEGE